MARSSYRIAPHFENLRDRMGTPWFWYRGNQGQYTVCADLASPDLAARHPLGHFLYGDFQREACQVLRGTGQLKPLALPPSVFFDYPAWYARVLEPEVLMGRLGVAGWDGWDFDVGLWLPGLKPDDPRFWEGIYNFFAGSGPHDASWWELGWIFLKSLGIAVLKIAGGILIVAGSTALGFLLGGPAGAAIGFKIGLGIGLSLLAVGAAMSVYQRRQAGQHWVSSVIGGPLDVLGVTELVAGISSYDLARLQHVELSSRERAELLGSGIGRLSAFFWGPKFYRAVTPRIIQGGIWGRAQYRGWRLGRLKARLAGRSALNQQVLTHIAQSEAGRTSSNIGAHFARLNQIRAGYDPDIWQMTTVRAGGKVYGGVPGQSAFYTDATTVRASQLRAQSLWESLQVPRDPDLGYRPSIRSYLASRALRVAAGTAQANTEFGAGGGYQYYIGQFEHVLQPRQTYRLTGGRN